MQRDMTLYDSILAAADSSQVEGLSRFFKTGPGQYGEGDKFLGIKVPVTRSIVKACWKTTGFEELERCIGNEYHELRLAALLALVEIYSHAKVYLRNRDAGACHSEACTELAEGQGEESLRRRCIDFYLSHTDRINNWDLVDLSCYPLLGTWLLDKDRSLLYELARSIADILLHHPHDLIHKAVGWLLREAGKRDRQALEDYLLPRYRQMPRTMLRYSIEKFPESERQWYLKGVV